MAAEDQTLAIFDIMNKQVGTVDSLSGSFIDDFRTSAECDSAFWRKVIQKIVNDN